MGYHSNCVYNRVRGGSLLHNKIALALFNLSECDGVPETMILMKGPSVPTMIVNRLIHSNHIWVAKDPFASWGLFKHYFEGKHPSSLLGWRDPNFDLVIQRLIPNPMLIEGRKFSIRSYVV